MEGSGRDIFKVLSQHLSGGTEENHKNALSKLPLNALLHFENLVFVSVAVIYQVEINYCMTS
jgi:hypothetical protein